MIAYSKLDCNAGTFLRSKVNTVTNPNAPAANHSGTAAQISTNNNKHSNQFITNQHSDTGCLM